MRFVVATENSLEEPRTTDAPCHVASPSWCAAGRVQSATRGIVMPSTSERIGTAASARSLAAGGTGLYGTW